MNTLQKWAMTHEPETKAKKGGKLTNADREGKQELVHRLFKQGINNKQIASMVGVTQKTVGKWLKPYKKRTNKLEETKMLLLDRINKALAEPTTPTEDLKNLAYTLSTIKPLLE